MPETKQLIIHSKVDLGKITSNFPELKQGIKEMVAPFVGLDLENIELKEKKNMLARVRKGKLAIEENMLARVRKGKLAIEDRRKSVKKEFLIPLNEFEQLCKELTSEFDVAINELDSSVKSQIQKERQDKRESLDEYISKKLEDDPLAEYIDSCEFFFDTSWLNSTYSDTKAKKEIDNKINEIKSAVELLSGLQFSSQLLDSYRVSGNLTAAIAMKKRLIEQEESSNNIQKLLKIHEAIEAEKEQKRLEAEKCEAERIEHEKVIVVKDQQKPLREEIKVSQDVKETPTITLEIVEEEPKTMTVRFDATGTTDNMIKLGDWCRENGIILKRV